MSEPIAISSTTFVDFLLATGTGKLTVVRRAKEQYGEPYDPRKDFWRGLRKGNVDMHETGAPPVTLDRLVQGL